MNATIRPSAQFDDFHPDLPRLLAEQEASLPPPTPGARSARGLDPLWGMRARARLYLTGALVKTDLYRRLVYAHLALGWFFEFRDYWTEALGNRPIEPHDFHFLHGCYRQRVGRVRPETGEDPDPGRVYALLHHTYRLAQHPLQGWRLTRYVPRGGHVLEYACGLAPVATSLIRFHRHLDVRITCADIWHLLFHFTRWRFRAYPFVRTVVVPPDTAPALDEPADLIVCLQMLKYVAMPLALVAALEGLLRPRGHLVLDYVPGEAPATARIEALRYLRERFEVVEGALPLDGSPVPRSVLRRRG